MNCKSGDLARVVANGKYYGTLVHVHSAAPSCEFLLPNGKPHIGVPPAHWVVELLGAPIPCSRDDGSVMLTNWGVAKDVQLRPIRGGEGDDQTLAWAGKPQQITEPTARAVEFARR